MQSMKQSSLDVMQDKKNGSIVSRLRSTHKLANQMNHIGDIWLCDNKINKTNDQLPIESSIKKRITIGGKKLDLGFKRSVGSLVVSRTSSKKKIRSIFRLREVIAICARSNLKSKKVIESTQVLYLKILTQKGLKTLYPKNVIPYDNHVINI